MEKYKFINSRGEEIRKEADVWSNGFYDKNNIWWQRKLSNLQIYLDNLINRISFKIKTLIRK